MKSQVRIKIAEHIRFLSSASELMAYPVFDEWVVMFTDDLFHPQDATFTAAFSKPELLDLCELYGLICHASKRLRNHNRGDIPGILKTPEWRWVMSKVQEMLGDYRNDNANP